MTGEPLNALCSSRSVQQSLALVLAAALGWGCRPELPPPVPRPPVIRIVGTPPAPPPPIRGEVLVRDEAWIYAAPGSPIRFRRDAGGPHETQRVHRYHVSRDEGAWVWVTPGASASGGRHCVHAEYALSSYAIELAVERSALAPVLARAEMLTFGDDTSLSLWPGVPVGAKRERDGWRALSTDAGMIFAPIAEDAVALSFVAAAPPMRAGPPLAKELTSNAEVTYAETQRVGVGGFPWRLQAITSDGDYRMLDLETDCFAMRARGYHDVLRDPHEPTGSGGMGVLGALAGGPWNSVPKGTPLSWANGAPAGTVMRGYSTSTKLVVRGDESCFTHVLGERGPAAERTVELCAPTASITPMKSALEGLVDEKP